MQGRRVHDTPPHRLEAGDFGRWAADSGNWYACCPDGKLANLSRHDVLEHPDGSITVAPSILVAQPGTSPPQWHGFLECGIWREV